VRPDFLPHQLWRLATQDVHLHGLLEVTADRGSAFQRGAVEFCEVAGANFLRVEQRGHDNQLAAAKSRLPNQQLRLAYGKHLWQLFFEQARGAIECKAWAKYTI